MKHLLKFIFPILVILLLVMCGKEELVKVQEPEPEKLYSINYIDDEDAPEKSGLKSGQSAFHFPISQVRVDLFSPLGATQTAFNMSKEDSTTFVRVSQPHAGAWGGYWDRFDIVYYFSNGSTKTYLNEYAPSYLGANYTNIPEPFNAVNPLDITNPHNMVTLIRLTKTETYTDFDCGVEKKRFYYGHWFDEVNVATNVITGDRCFSNVFSFPLPL